MTRANVAPIKRIPLTKWQFATLFLEQGGKCASCDCKLQKSKTRDEHIVSLFGGGSNEMSNRALWCVSCTKPKNRDDAARAAKIKRLRGDTGNGPKREIPQPKNAWPKGRKLPTKADRERIMR